MLVAMSTPIELQPLGSEQALDVVADRWFVRVVHALMDGHKRYGELQRLIPEISKKMLTQTLRGMERDGLVTRKIYPVVPPHTEYALTELGESVVAPLQQLCHWAKAHVKQIEEHRFAFDQIQKQDS